MSMSPGDGQKLASAVERMAAALEQGNKSSLKQGARFEQLVIELYSLRMMLFLAIKHLQPEIQEKLEAELASLAPPKPPKVLAPEPEPEGEHGIEAMVARALERALSQPAGRAPSSGAPPQRQRPPQTGHQVVPQGARLGQNLRERLKTEGATQKPTPLVPAAEEEPEEGVDLRKFARKAAEQQ